MAFEYAQKWPALLDKALTTEGFTNSLCNRNYDLVGVDTIKIQSLETVEADDYDKTKTDGNRFGRSTELENRVQTVVLSQDKSFEITIDRATLEDSAFAVKSTEVMGAELRERIIPMIDKYVLGVIAAADTDKDTTAITKNNAYDVFLSLSTKLDDNQVPLVGRICAVKPEVYKKLMLDPSFIKASDKGMDITMKGFTGTIDDVAIIKVPSLYFPENVDMIMTHPIATTKADKTTMTRILTDVRDIDGAVLQGRFRYDAFVLDKKIGCIATHGTASSNSSGDDTTNP